MEVDHASGNAFAGDSAARMPSAGDLVCYYPKIHALHANTLSPDSRNSSFFQLHRFPPLMFPCKVVSTILPPHSISDDEVYATMTLCPVTHCSSASPPALQQVKAVYFEKVLSRTFAGNGGSFYVSRACANSLFPALNHRLKLPAQILTFMDASGEAWKFKHVYRGKARGHFLTDGWREFVQGKSLVQGDSVIFTRNLNGQLLINVHRTADRNSNWPNEHVPFQDEENSAGKEGCCPRRTRCRISQEAVVEAMSSAFAGKPFEVLHYPKVGLPEFVVAKESVKTSSAVPRESGMKRSLKAAAL